MRTKKFIKWSCAVKSALTELTWRKKYHGRLRLLGLFWILKDIRKLFIGIFMKIPKFHI